MEILNQRYLLSTKRFALDDNEIRIKEKSPFKTKIWKAGYEEIGFEIVKIKSRDGVGSSILFGVLFIFSAIISYRGFHPYTGDVRIAYLFLFFSAMWLTFFWWSVQKFFASYFVLIGGTKELSFFINDPDEQHVLEFIYKIRAKVKIRYIKEYATFNSSLSLADQLTNISYLRSRGIITQHECNRYHEELYRNHSELEENL